MVKKSKIIITLKILEDATYKFGMNMKGDFYPRIEFIADVLKQELGELIFDEKRLELKEEFEKKKFDEEWNEHMNDKKTEAKEFNKTKITKEEFERIMKDLK